MNAGHPAVNYRELFENIRTVAIVGYSDNPERAGHFVAHYLKKQGYDVLSPDAIEHLTELSRYVSS